MHLDISSPLGPVDAFLAIEQRCAVGTLDVHDVLLPYVGLVRRPAALCALLDLVDLFVLEPLGLVCEIERALLLRRVLVQAVGDLLIGLANVNDLASALVDDAIDLVLLGMFGTTPLSVRLPDRGLSRCINAPQIASVQPL